jgi:18S rRNA (adenine1779-N6/adenine1780-N6)-dimethyltransferase
MPKERRERAQPKVTGGGIIADKSKGQNFLVNKHILDAIVEKAGVKPTDVVTEIGPGLGHLTFRLLEKAKKLITIELDPRMVAEIQRKAAEHEKKHSLQIIFGDILKTELPYFDLCVANVPYNISSAIVFKLLAHRPPFRAAILLFQEEFALRLSAKPGDELYCRLSVNTQLLARVDQLIKVGRNNFRPPPKVESRVVRLEPRVPPPPVNFVEWDGMIRLAFNRKNKTLRSVLTTSTVLELLEKNMRTLASVAGTPVPPGFGPPAVQATLEKVLDETGFRECRASKMSIDDFLALLAAMNAAGVHFA